MRVRGRGGVWELRGRGIGRGPNRRSGRAPRNPPSERALQWRARLTIIATGSLLSRRALWLGVRFQAVRYGQLPTGVLVLPQFQINIG